MKFCFDIDGVLATTVENMDYLAAEPIQENIDLVNRMYNQGHHITLFTARGSETGTPWSKRTHIQMSSFGVKFHRCLTGKPYADMYIDDHNATLEDAKEVLRKNWMTPGECKAMSELEVLCVAARKIGIHIHTMLLDSSNVAVVAPGDYFMLLPEDLNNENTWYYGPEDQACAFIEGLIIGAKFERVQEKKG